MGADMGLLNGANMDNNLHHSYHLHHPSSLQNLSSLGLGQPTPSQANTAHLMQSQQFQQNDLEPSRMAPCDLANIAHLKRSDSYFMSDELRSELLRKNLLILAVPSQEVASRIFEFFF